MWWEAVFWILLLPLVVVEIIVFLRTKRFSWLLYSLAIFTYVVAVSYTLDVFSAGRNAVILTLLASSGLMVLIGRHLGRKVRKAKRASRGNLIAVWTLIGVLALLFIVSAVFGRLSETTMAVSSVSKDDITQVVAKPGELPPTNAVTLLTRQVHNPFILPVPLKDATYRACVQTSVGMRELTERRVSNLPPEVAGRADLTVNVKFDPAWVEASERVTGTHVLVYQFLADSAYTERSWASCDDLGEPDFRVLIS